MEYEFVDWEFCNQYYEKSEVLILVVVEYEFVEIKIIIYEVEKDGVLILVVVEYEFVDGSNRFFFEISNVLILVVVEYEFVEIKRKWIPCVNMGLNPCCSGIWIRRDIQWITVREET